jgi:uncharacterized damage-inducible protein DinB
MAKELAALTCSALITELEQQREAVHALAANLPETDLWRRPIEPGNSIGHLILHLTGNLNTYVGAQLGDTGYVRDREKEFTDTNPPSRKVALANLDAAVATFRRIVEGLRAEQLMAAHPETRFRTVLDALVHLVAHFALHRGQMSYIARLLKPSGGRAAATSP